MYNIFKCIKTLGDCISLGNGAIIRLSGKRNESFFLKKILFIVKSNLLGKLKKKILVKKNGKLSNANAQFIFGTKKKLNDHQDMYFLACYLT